MQFEAHGGNKGMLSEGKLGTHLVIRLCMGIPLLLFDFQL